MYITSIVHSNIIITLLVYTYIASISIQFCSMVLQVLISINNH